MSEQSNAKPVGDSFYATEEQIQNALKDVKSQEALTQLAHNKTMIAFLKEMYVKTMGRNEDEFSTTYNTLFEANKLDIQNNVIRQMKETILTTSGNKKG